MTDVIGLDIGGANTKAALITYHDGEISNIKTKSIYFPVWKQRHELLSLLKQLKTEFCTDRIDAVGIVMTAELSDAYRTKREGVLEILEITETAFEGNQVYTIDIFGKMHDIKDAKRSPLDFAAANWCATAKLVAEAFSTGLFIDTGSTTTDIIPFQDGTVLTFGKNDLDRLISGELIYTGALRTNVAAVVTHVPVKNRLVRICPEYFAISADVHLVLGHINSGDYSCETPDGRGKTKEYALERLARTICADIELLETEELENIAQYVYLKQVAEISNGINRVTANEMNNIDQRLECILTGIGKDFLAKPAAQKVGIKQFHDLDEIWTGDLALCAPSAAIAILTARLN
ncbi:hydantoinase/oxoprolinase family protein [Candidatus Borrarchaeum sp.]|uniref:hydantoinase/oxoprolinase family protein n=1 Tax=Candidatus Borrarchaeum sp. TaxID=2846742 RepID=UPI00257E64B1|nr:hydantoinase/oxoprolinase family protein [Candidatus Borrarchaeum sp.]